MLLLAFVCYRGLSQSMGWYSNIYLAIVINDQQVFNLDILLGILRTSGGRKFNGWCGPGDLEICTDSKTSTPLVRVLFKEYDDQTSKVVYDCLDSIPKAIGNLISKYSGGRKFLFSTNIKYGTDGDLEHIINSLIKYNPGIIYMKGDVQGEDCYAECNIQGCERYVSNKVFWL